MSVFRKPTSYWLGGASCFWLRLCRAVVNRLSFLRLYREASLLKTNPDVSVQSRSFHVLKLGHPPIILTSHVSSRDRAPRHPPVAAGRSARIHRPHLRPRGHALRSRGTAVQ